MDGNDPRDVLFDIGGDRQRIHNIQTQGQCVTFQAYPGRRSGWRPINTGGKTSVFVVNGAAPAWFRERLSRQITLR